MGGNNAALAESVVEKFEVGFLEEGLGRALGIRRVGDDDVEGVLVVVEELEAIADVDLDLGVLVAGGHLGEILFGQTDDSLEMGSWG